jgi:short-subunit dehydrogenase involved in D-alanine esterification of teichoic acids
VDLSNRTVLIVGGTSGIGRELARRFAAAGSTVAVGGRSPEALSELAGEGFGTFGIDVTDSASVASARDAVLARYPELDTVVTMSGVMLLEDLPSGSSTPSPRTWSNAAPAPSSPSPPASPSCRSRPCPPTPPRKPRCTPTPRHCAHNSRGTDVSVVELVPPAVATARQEKVNPHALPLDDFAAEVVDLLSHDLTPDEILVERVLVHRWAERDGTYDDLVAQRSQALAMLPGRQG